MTPAKLKPGQSKRPFDLKDAKPANKKRAKEDTGFELSDKDTDSKSKESRNDQ
jgi:hypothetical protein